MDSDSIEGELSPQVVEYTRNRERQWAGVDRHFKLPDGFGYFTENPDTISEDVFRRGKCRIEKVYDVSNQETNVEGKPYKKASGSFNLELSFYHGGGTRFPFAHPDDIVDFLQKAGTADPQDLTGKDLTVYWISMRKEEEPVPGERIVGVDLPEYRIKLSDLKARSGK